MATNEEIERYLSASDFARLSEALSDSVCSNRISPSALAAILLLLFTDLPRPRLLSLHWEEVDLDGECLRLRGDWDVVEVVKLNLAARTVLGALDRDDDNSYVLPGETPNSHLTRLQTAWLRVGALAGFSHLRLDDLEHTFTDAVSGSVASLRALDTLVRLGRPERAAKPRPAGAGHRPRRSDRSAADGRTATTAPDSPSEFVIETMVPEIEPIEPEATEPEAPEPPTFSPDGASAAAAAKPETTTASVGFRAAVDAPKLAPPVSKMPRAERFPTFAKLAALATIFVAVPLLLYNEFRSAELDKRKLMLDVVQEQGRLIAQGLRPMLQDQEGGALLSELNGKLSQFGDGQMRIKLLLRPAGLTEQRGFFFVASQPVVPNNYLERERAELLHTGILDKLLHSCDGGTSLAVRYTNPAGEKETLTSVTPITAAQGCYVMITSYPSDSLIGSSVGEPYWSTSQVQVAAAIYMLMAILVMSLLYGMTRYRRRLEFALDEIREKRDQLELALSNAQTATRAKSDFLAIMSHELRTPLNAIIGFAEIMFRELFGPVGNRRYRDYLSGILDSANHQLAIIGDLLDMSKIEAGQIQMHEEIVDLSRTIYQCRTLVAEQAGTEGLKIVLEVPADLPHLVADERIVKQMLLNLLSNSIKFTPEHGIITVTLAMERSGGLAIRVADSGIGMEASDFEKVLTPFGQVQSPYNRSHAGLGLGLPLVKSMIEAHGGWLELASEPNVGTAVTLHFPAVRVRPLVAAPMRRQAGA